MSELAYGFEQKLERTAFEEAVQKVTEALQKEGFGVLTEIDVKNTLKRKLNVDFRRYLILGACNLVLAQQALEAEAHIGLLPAVQHRGARGPERRRFGFHRRSEGHVPIG